MIVLDTTTRKLQVKTDSVFSVESPVVASWDDITTSAFTPGANQSVTTNSTPIDIIAAPGASTQRVVKYLSICNSDLAARVVTVIYNDNGTTRNVLVATLQIGDSITYSNGVWTQITSAGKITANFVYAGPTAGGGAAPTFRALVAADIPSITQAMLASKNREFYNYLINGGHQVHQRTNSCGNGSFVTIASLVLGTDKYACDKWKIAAETAAATKAQRVDTNGALESGLNAQHYLTLQANGTGKICAYQILEGINTLPLAGRSVVFQCKLKASGAKTLRIGLIQLNSSGTMDSFPTMMSAAGANSTDPTLGTNLARIAPNDLAGTATGTIVGNGVNVAVNTTWVPVGASFTVPANMKNLAVAVWTDSQFANADTLSIGELMLTDGELTKDWLPRLQQEELSLAQKFCYAIQSDANNSYIALGAFTSSSAALIDIRFPVTMRVKPALSHATIGNFHIQNSLGNDSACTGSFVLSSDSGVDYGVFQVTGTGTPYAAGQVARIYFNTGATGTYVIFDADL